MVKRLYVLDCGLFHVHGPPARQIGIPAYLLQLTDGRNVLVDTGFPAKYAHDPVTASAEDDLGAFGDIVTLTPNNLVAAQLALCGVLPTEIDTLILTHTHIDHIGALPDFAHATIVVGQAERMLPTPLYWNDRSPIAWPEAHYQTIEQDYDMFPGVRLLATPGHSPGHLSLMLTLADGHTMLLTGDAISRPAEVDTRFVGSWDAAQACASADRLLALASATEALLIYGHDPEQWPTLKKAPLFYN